MRSLRSKDFILTLVASVRTVSTRSARPSTVVSPRHYKSSVSLPFNPIGDAGAAAWAAAIAAGRLPKQIKWLDLGGCNIGNEGGKTRDRF